MFRLYVVGYVTCAVIIIAKLLVFSSFFLTYCVFSDRLTDCLRAMKLRESGVRDARVRRDWSVSREECVEVVVRVFFSELCECSYTRKTTWCSRTRDVDKDVISSKCSNSCY